MLKILCVIDSLGSGGAQRQMVNLLLGLKARGHAVEVFVYYPEYKFFRAELDAVGIQIHEIRKKQGFSLRVTYRLIRLYRKNCYDGIISFLEAPNTYAELAKVMSFSKTQLIVSERCSLQANRIQLKKFLQYFLHIFATHVTTNSHTQAKYLSSFPWLKKKISVIYNGYTLGGTVVGPSSTNKDQPLQLLAIGRISRQKNPYRLLQAIIIYAQKYGHCPEIFWVGVQQDDPASRDERASIDKILSTHPTIARKWHWLGERHDIYELLSQADALIHVSLYEGLPNVVCEALVRARPVIASCVCDHSLLVKNGVRGFLCDPYSPESICDAIRRFDSLSAEERKCMGRNARVYAQDHLSIEKLISSYESLFFKTS